MDNNNELLFSAVAAVTTEWAEAFDKVWSREDATQLMALYLDGRIEFRIGLDGVTIVELLDTPAV